jgi:hypothetical protein
MTRRPAGWWYRLKATEKPVQRVRWENYRKCPSCAAWPSEACYMMMQGAYLSNEHGLPRRLKMPHASRQRKS